MQAYAHMLLFYLQFAILLTNKIDQNFLSKQTTGPSGGLFSWKILNKEIPALFVTILFDKCGVYRYFMTVKKYVIKTIENSKSCILVWKNNMAEWNENCTEEV